MLRLAVAFLHCAQRSSSIHRRPPRSPRSPTSSTVEYPMTAQAIDPSQSGARQFGVMDAGGTTIDQTTRATTPTPASAATSLGRGGKGRSAIVAARSAAAARLRTAADSQVRTAGTGYAMPATASAPDAAPAEGRPNTHHIAVTLTITAAMIGQAI